MPNLNQIKTKIKSVQNLKKITRALEVVSTVKLQKTKDKAENLKTYLLDLMYILNNTATKTSIFEQEQTNSNKNLVIVITSERGLCWWLNSKLLKKVHNEYHNLKENTDFFVIWKKWLEFISRNQYNIVWSLSVSDSFNQEELKMLFDYIDYSVNNWTYKNIKIYFNFFNNTLTQTPTSLDLFPISRESFNEFLNELNIDYQNTADFRGRDLLIEPDKETVVNEIKRQIRNYFIMSALIQNKTWEFASRMIAMKNAKDNSESTIHDLTLTFNKLRQGSITQEISEIVGAKTALE